MADTEIFQHYQVLKRPDGSLWELGRGAMGVTYKAFDTSLRCQVALKVINATYLDSDMAQQRFLREARAAAGLSHPNVASVFHLGESGGNYFYAMEFIDGETLEAFVRRQGPLPPVLALQIALQVARALRAASKEGLVHRDIKPANLMLMREEDDEEVHVKVIDFGLAKVSHKDGEASATITVAGFVGTPHFASPEQLEEKDLDVRSDMYSLGVSLWYMLVGRPPFAGSVVQIMSQHLTRRPPFEQMTGMPAEVIHLLEHLLEKDAAKRPQTASDLRREIEHVIRDLRAAGAATLVAGLPGAAAAPGQLDSSFPTQAMGDETGQLTSREPASGVVLANRYRLMHEIGQGDDGSRFQAIELDSGRTVTVQLLGAGVLATPEQFSAEEEKVKQARQAAHPALLEIYSLERSGAHAFLTYEWVNGFTVLDLLRNRHALTVQEALLILEPLAAAADHARFRGLSAPGMLPGEIQLAFGATVELAARTLLLTSSLAGWPEFHPKVMPLTWREEPAGLATWEGQQTIVPVAKVAPGVVRQLALLTYELLGGSPTHQAPLPALSEKGNAVLRDAALKNGVFAGAAEFVTALRASLTAGVAEGPVRPASSVAAPAFSVAPAAATRAPAPATPPTLIPPPESALAVPTALPPSQPLPANPRTPPAPASGMPATAAAGKSRGPLVAVLVLVFLCGIVGVIAGLGFAAWKFLLPQAQNRLASLEAALPGGRPTPPTVSPTPAVRRALPLETPAPSVPPIARAVPFSSVAAASPLPSPSLAQLVQPTPAPVPDRMARFKELLEKAQSLDRAGASAAALDAFVSLAQDYPDLDQGLSRVDSLVSATRAAPLASDSEERRAQQLRQPMERAAGLGSELAMLFLGDHLLATEPETAADWYRKAADKGEPEGMFALGNMYFKGTGVEAQPAEAAKWFELASNKGFVRAKIYLAECYEEGKGGVTRDPERAFGLLNEALVLDPNNAVAMEKLGIDYEKGRGTAVDVHKAFSLMQRAVDLHDVNALGNLGVYYMTGKGGPRDPKKAVQLFKAGADKRNALCMFYYAQVLYNGVPGTPANRSDAESYYRAAAEAGFGPARDWCKQKGVAFVGSD